MKEQLKKLVKLVTTPDMRDAFKRGMVRGCGLLKGHGGRRIFPKGVNLIGHIRGDFGLGESCRLVAGALQKADLPFTIRNVTVHGDAPETNTAWSALEGQQMPYWINIIHVDPVRLKNSIFKLGLSTFRCHYNIGFFLWEQPEFPKEWDYALSLMDEIWTPAEFITQAIGRRTRKPVYTMPYGISRPRTDPRYSRSSFGLPEGICLFMLSYDGNSISERKNPLGSVRAYVQAFSREETGVGLVIKATHARPEELRQFTRLLEGYPNITILTDSYSRVEFNSLLACVDVYLSLHRAEGFGLVMAEAMQLGTAVIATNWSANTEFMNDDVACMVSADVIELTEDCFPYKKGTHWAQPREEQAAAFMRRLYEDPGYRRQKAEAARAYIEEKLSPQQAARRMKERIEQLYQGESG